MNKLNPNFMAELFKLMFIDESIIRIVSGHLTYQHIPKEWVGYKFIFREAVEQFNEKGVVPSLGVVSQKFINNDEVLEVVDEIKKARLVDRELIIDQLESFIKETEFVLLSKKIHDLYEEGKKDEAIRINAEESKKILEISLRGTGGNFVQVFRGFEERSKIKRLKREKNQNKKNFKIKFGIDKLDDISDGGAELGDTVLWIMRSGIGKSTALKWHGFRAAIEGEPVFHIQLEGGIDAAVDKYDQIWTNFPFSNIKSGELKESDLKKVRKTVEDMRRADRDIDIYGFKKFGEASVEEVRNLIIDYQKIHGYFPKVLVIDSLDLLKTGLNKKLDNDPDYKKEKLERVAQLLKDIAVEFNCVVFTATQTCDVPIEVWNNEDKVIDRSYTEGNRTLVKPFSFVFTGNVTMKEKKDNLLRIYIDKLRDYKDSQEIVKIVTKYDKGRFYSKSRTLALYKEIEEDEKEKEETGTTKRRKQKSIGTEI